jgi:c-di-GMP-binding flagellar brake protein YcgR
VISSERRLDPRKNLPTDFAVRLHPQDLFDGGPPLVGRAIDLTMGGIGVLLSAPLEAALQSEVWTMSFAVPDKTGRSTELSLNALITHGRPHAEGYFYGLKFHELQAPEKSRERAALRQYLLSDLRERWQGNQQFHASAASQ